MRKISFALTSTLFLMFGCASGAGNDTTTYEEESIATAEGMLTATATVTSAGDWGTRYCLNISLTNGLTSSASGWQTVIDLAGTTVTSVTNAQFSGTTGVITASPLSGSAAVASGQSTQFGFCANAPSASARAVIKAWNMRSDAYKTCPTNSGLMPAKAALAVAMAKELGRWTPNTDLAVVNGQVTLSSTGQARCGGASAGRKVGGTCYKVCSSASKDPDGDGWGWENNASCLVVGSAPYNSGTDCGSGMQLGGVCWPACSSASKDPDGDGWGWENNASCIVMGSAPAQQSTSCSGGCPNTVALLGQQNSVVTQFVDQTLFNPVNYSQDLQASFGRQRDLINNLTLNNPSALPPNHRLKLVHGPTDLGVGACGPHYVFEVDDANGNPLTTTQAANLANALCFYGQGSCGSNPYLAFTQTSVQCPTGRTCIAIDPTDGDNSTTSTTTAGSAPTYPMNRVYDPTNSLLNQPCVTTMGKLGTLVSKCSTAPSTCGYLYCIANY